METQRSFANHVTINLYKKKVNGAARAPYRTRNSLHRKMHNSNYLKNSSLPKIHESSQTDSDRYKESTNSVVERNPNASSPLAEIISTVVNEPPNITAQRTLSISSSDILSRNTSEIKNTSNKTLPNSSSSLSIPGKIPPSRQCPLNTRVPPLSPGSKAPGPSLPQTHRNRGGDDLTSLSWLQSLDMVGVVPHLAAPPTPPASPLSGQTNQPVEEPPPEPPKKIDYSIDGSVKPPYSYAALIGMAMKENDNKMTLSAIYKWIKEHFIFYKTADQSWQNSIRHNLSLNKCFLKVPRSKEEPGKGGFWTLDPEYADALVDGVFKKKRPTRGTAPPTTKAKRKRPSPYTQQIQEHVKKQKQKEQEEFLRQKEQEEAVKSLTQSVQSAYMPPICDKPPVSSLYITQQETIDQSLLVDESGNPLKEDLVWSSILGEETVQDECWQFGPQEVITDLTHSGDPSTYHITASPASSISSMSSNSTVMSNFDRMNPRSVNGHVLPQQIPHSCHSAQTLPSLDLSPESLGVEENLFGSPEYSEASSEDRDYLIHSLDLGVGLDLAVSTSNWESKISLNNTISKNCGQSLAMLEENTGVLMNVESSHDLIEFHDLEGNLTQLTTMEPAGQVIVQQVNSSQCWPNEQNAEDARTISLLEANLDFDKLIDLDVI